ncbi:MAG: histidine ammonia-lyase [Eubacteriales bacterium]
MSIILDGKNLTVEDVIKVARHFEKVELSEEAKKQVTRAREYVDKKLAQGTVIYGLTTGFGKFADTVISESEAQTLQRNLIISHSCAMGEPYSTEVVRSIMLLRCNALARGNSGIRLSTLETLINMINKRVHPIIPQKGSLGASGDLAPLSHMVLAMIGEGDAEYCGEVLKSKEAMRRAGIGIIDLAAKEGLALINGTQVMTAVGLNVLADAMDLMEIADLAAAFTGEALNCITKAYDSKVHELRGHEGQIATGKNLLRLLEGSKNAQETHKIKVQDPYTLRCVPQIHGASKDAINYVYEAVSKEINAVTDNPLIFVDEDEVISGGNFHGQPMALAFDFLKIAVSEYANVSERRLERLVNPQLSEGLPAFLTKNGGVCSGFMITQYAAASMVSENKIYDHPASVDSIPSSANQEDHVSMGTTAARTAAMVLDNTRKVLAIELLAASQAIWLRGENCERQLGKYTKKAYAEIRKSIRPIEEDVIMHKEINKMEELIKNGTLIKAIAEER